MKGQVSHEIEVKVPAGQAWELYCSTKLATLVAKESDSIEEIAVVEGDGGVGTVMRLKFTPSMAPPGIAGFKEKITKVDSEKRIRDTEVVEGGYLDVGFTLFRVVFEIAEKGTDSCVIKSRIEYELNEDAAANASLASVDLLTNIEKIASNYLINNNRD